MTTTCTVDGCERARKYRLYCRPHYSRLHRTGDLGPAEIRLRASGTTDERFDARIAVVQGPLRTPCHEWQGYRNEKNYGTFGAANGHVVSAHRWSYTRAHGSIPSALQLDHLCRNPPCVNPDHLEPVTSRENHMRSPGLAPGTRTHCPQGHEYTPENTIRTRNGDQPARKCRTCVNTYRLAWWHRQQEKKRSRGELRSQQPRTLATHCRRGHPFDEANTHHQANGYRRCRRCWADRARERRAAKTSSGGMS